MSLVLCYFLAATGQPDTELQKQVMELRSRVRCLEEDNREIRAAQRSADSLTYCAIRLEIFEAVSGISKLDFDFTSTSEKIAVTGLFTRLMQANNPASDILGFRFTELVFASVDKHFGNGLRNETDRRRFGQVVQKIVANPVVSSIAGINPVSSVVTSIITAIVGFTTARVHLDKDGGRIRDVAVEQHDPFELESIAAFRNDMQVYIQFYDELISLSDRYLSGLDHLDRKYAFLMESVNEYRTQITGLAGSNLVQITSALPNPEQHELDFHRLVGEENIGKMLVVARKYPVVKQSVNDFKREYSALLFNYLETYAASLEKAAGFPDAAIEKSKISALIREINDFIDNQRKALQPATETTVGQVIPLPIFPHPFHY